MIFRINDKIASSELLEAKLYSDIKNRNIPFDDINNASLFFNSSINPLLDKAYVSYYRNLTSSSRLFKRPIIFVKRIIRKFMKFLILPIIDEQNDYNHILATSLYKANKEIDELKRKLDELSKRSVK